MWFDMESDKDLGANVDTARTEQVSFARVQEVYGGLGALANPLRCAT